MLLHYDFVVDNLMCSKAVIDELFATSAHQIGSMNNFLHNRAKNYFLPKLASISVWGNSFILRLLCQSYCSIFVEMYSSVCFSIVFY